MMEWYGFSESWRILGTYLVLKGADPDHLVSVLPRIVAHLAGRIAVLEAALMGLVE